MDITALVAAFVLTMVGYTAGSVKIINEGNQALIERLGKYRRTLYPGVNFIIPFLDNIVLEDTTRERVLEVEPQKAITSDNVSLEIDAVVFWQVFNLKDSYYEIQDVEEAIKNLVVTTLRSQIGRMELSQSFSSRESINAAVTTQLNEATKSWGVEVKRIEIQNISPARTVLESMELEKASQIKKRAAISEAEGTMKAIELISRALRSQDLTHDSQEVLQYLLAQKFVEANYKLGDSPNSKILFMDPKAINDALTELLRKEGDDRVPRANQARPENPANNGH